LSSTTFDRTAIAEAQPDKGLETEGLLVDVEVARRPSLVSAAFMVDPGHRLALFGPSGAGKTTLLELVAGLLRPDRGLIRLNGRVLTSTSPPRQAVPLAERRVGLLRQPAGLFPHLTVEENAAYGSGGPIGGEGRALLEELGLDRHRQALPVALSGGQCQRVAVARVLLSRFEVLLLDEPFNGLDAAIRSRVNQSVHDRAAARRAPVVLVTHDLPEAQAFAHRLGIMDDGRLLQVGEAHDVVAAPATRRVAELVGYRGFVPTTLPGRDGLVCIHPQRIRLGAHPEHGMVLSGIVSALRPSGVGFEAEVIVNTADRIVCAMPGSSGEPGLDAGGPGPAMADVGRVGEVGRSITITVLDPPHVPKEG